MDLEAAFSLLVVAAGALSMPAVARRVGVPVAVTEILYGIVVGRSALGLVGTGAGLVKFTADLGFGLFLFLAGMEIDVASLYRGGPRALAFPAVASGLIMATAFAASAALGGPAWLGLSIGVVSIPLALVVLRELDLVQSTVGKRVMLVAGLGELLSIGVLAMFDLGEAARTSGAVGLVLGLAWAMVPVIVTLAAAVFLRSLLWWYPGPFMRFAAAADPQELGVRAGFALMFGGMVVAGYGGIEPVLGAFFAGLLVSFVVRGRDVLEHKLGGIAYGFFVPVFFVSVGSRLAVSPSVVVHDTAFMASVLLAMVLSRVPAFLAFASAGFRIREAAAGGLLLASPLTLQIAVADLAARNGVFGESDEAAVILAAVTAGVLFPAAARRLLGRGG